MSCTFIISTGEFLKPDGSHLCRAYAGQPPHVNDPEAVALHNIGPLPPGRFIIGKPMNIDTDPANWMAALRHMGPFVMPLEPCPDENLKLDWLGGRGGFYLHGDSVEHPGTASNGCVIPKGTPFVSDRQMREAIAEIRKTDDVLIVKLRPDPIVS